MAALSRHQTVSSGSFNICVMNRTTEPFKLANNRFVGTTVQNNPWKSIAVHSTRFLDLPSITKCSTWCSCWCSVLIYKSLLKCPICKVPWDWMSYCHINKISLIWSQVSSEEFLSTSTAFILWEQEAKVNKQNQTDIQSWTHYLLLFLEQNSKTGFLHAISSLL